MRVIEWLSALLAAAALAGATLVWVNDVTRALLALSLVAALVTTYACIRVQMDVTIFERWEEINIAALDQALMVANRNFTPGRSLHSRIEGSLSWWRRGLGALAIQVALCAGAIFFS